MRILHLFLPALLTASTWEQRFQHAESLEQQGRYADALGEFESLLPEAEHLGGTDAKLPLTLHNLGVVSRDLGRYPEAERYYTRAIALWQSNPPAWALDLASSLQNLGTVNILLDRPARAEPLYRRAYELRLQRLGPSHPLAAAALHGLAEIAQQRHHASEADALYREASVAMEAAMGPNSPATADVWHNHALLLRDLHRDTEALPLLERAESVYEHAAPTQPKYAIVLRNLAELVAARQDTTRAAGLFAHSLRICDTYLPPGHPQTGIILQAYARFLSQTGRRKESAALSQRARAILDASSRQSGTAYTVDASSFREK